MTSFFGEGRPLGSIALRVGHQGPNNGCERVASNASTAHPDFGGGAHLVANTASSSSGLLSDLNIFYWFALNI